MPVKTMFALPERNPFAEKKSNLNGFKAADTFGGLIGTNASGKSDIRDSIRNIRKGLT